MPNISFTAYNHVTELLLLDEDYISFLNALNAPANTEPVSIETLGMSILVALSHYAVQPSHSVAAIQPPTLPKTTPLLEALKAEKSAHKDKESILRNHSHYKEQPAGLGSTPRKDDPKRKGPTSISKTVLTTPDASNVAPSGGVGGKKSQKKGQAHASNAAVVPLHPMVAQKAATQVNTTAKNINIAPVPTPAPRSPKALRAPRLPPQLKTKVVLPPSTHDVPIVAIPGQAVPGPTARRARPVVGLGSRQFEAALNGAGVSSPGERKSRREREREKEVADESFSVPSDGLVPTETKLVHSSPKRDRGGRKEPAQAQASGGAGAEIPALALAGGPLDLAKVPGILQREGPPAPGVTKPPLDNDSSVTVPTQDAGPPPFAGPPFLGGRGGRRGRGRGRGARGG